jgi:hypothetical protein
VRLCRSSSHADKLAFQHNNAISRLNRFNRQANSTTRLAVKTQSIPPWRMSQDARAELIKELEHAARDDERGEQTHDPSNDWLAWDSFRGDRDEATAALKALERGQSVPWGV